jgi:membrane fusion protein (multidrug efflux system)
MASAKEDQDGIGRLRSEVRQSQPLSGEVPSDGKGSGDKPAAGGLDRSQVPTPRARPDDEQRMVELPLRGTQAEDRYPDADYALASDSRKALLRRNPVASVVGSVLLTTAAGLGYLYLDHAWRFQTTDDAFVAARQFSIAPQVPGYITAVSVTDNQHVAAGGTIARIDDRNYRIAVAQSQAQVEAAQANVQNIDAQIDGQQAQIDASQAQVAQAEAALVFAQEQATRYQHLAQTGYGSVQNDQQHSSQLRQQQATLDSAQASLKVAQRQLESLKAQRSTALANVEQSKAQRDQAQLNLSYTNVTAQQAGRVVALGAAVGQFALQGTALAMFVPDEIWVTANYKETQLDSMRPGQPVTVHIDAYPERNVHGRVASVQPGSGTAFSLLPAENATGNYVKIVQRVPVKIILEDPPSDVALGPGMSVVPTVRIDPSPSLGERLRSWL